MIMITSRYDSINWYIKLVMNKTLAVPLFRQQEATAMNPDMTVEKIEIQQQSTQP